MGQTIHPAATSQSTSDTLDAPGPMGLWHLASFDAPTVAAVWSLGFAEAAGVRLPLWLPVLLALATWSVYVSDRLLDARSALRTRQFHCLRQRHYFHWQHRRVFFPFALAAACTAVWLIFCFMPSEARERNALLALASATYFSGVHGRPQLRPLLPKELLVAVLFTAGCALPALSRCAHTSLAFMAAIVFFAGLAWLNCHAIERWESEEPARSGPQISSSAGLLALAGFAGAIFLFAVHSCVAGSDGSRRGQRQPARAARRRTRPPDSFGFAFGRRSSLAHSAGVTASMNLPPNFSRLARLYRWLELFSFGPWLMLCRCAFLSECRPARRALALGDGDGRFTERMLHENSAVMVDAVDASSAMLDALLRRAGPHAGRVRAIHADLRSWQPENPPYDLIVTHFILDCLTTEEVQSLAASLARVVTPGALWIVSDFAIPANWFGRLVARPVVLILYLAFGWLTGLEVRSLPDHSSALRQALTPFDRGVT